MMMEQWYELNPPLPWLLRIMVLITIADSKQVLAQVLFFKCILRVKRLARWLKAPVYSGRGPSFDSQHPQGGSQPTGGASSKGPECLSDLHD